MLVNALERTGGGRFRRGVSGNPGGRPKGTRALLVQGLDQIAPDDIGDVIQANGDGGQVGFMLWLDAVSR